MSMLRTFLTGAAGAIALSVTAATAGPFSTPSQAPAAATGDLVTRVHGFHRHCEWGPAGPHRHEPGYGRIPCGAPGGYAPPPRYYPPRYPSARDRHCAVVYNQCFPLGRGSPAYVGCMRAQGC